MCCSGAGFPGGHLPVARPAEAASSRPSLTSSALHTWSLTGFYKIKLNGRDMTCVKPSSDFSSPSEVFPEELKGRPFKKSSGPCKRKSLPLSGINSSYPTPLTASPPAPPTYTRLTLHLQPCRASFCASDLCFPDKSAGCVWCSPPLLLHFSVKLC